MRILHYFLGFPPYRSGGLTKYATDLMKAQVFDGHTVMGLWPGQMRWINKRIRIKNRKNIDGIKNFELINPLPVALDEGITDFEAYMQLCDASVYKKFLEDTKPDVIHIHTLMGVHREFIETAAQLKIRTVFTTHDYFGICPKVTLYRHGETCESDCNCKKCVQCNCRALSVKKIKIMQSPLYRILKNSAVVKRFRKQHRDNFFTNEDTSNMANVNIEEVALKYQQLRTYYIGLLEKMDLIHFNSSVTENVYKKYLTPKNSIVMTITHQNIVDNRKVNEWKAGDKLRITSLAPAKPFKGFNVLKLAMDELWDSGKRDFELHIFSPIQNPSSYMKIQEKGFDYNQLKDIFADTDVLVAPSVWYETFGYTVLEALSYSIPVIVSDRVGAKDIVGDGGIIVEANNVDSLKNAILFLSEEKLNSLRNYICDHVTIKKWDTFVKENYSLYD